MNFNLSINLNIIDKGKVSADGWQNAIMDVQKLATHVQNGFAFAPGSIRNPKQSQPKPTSNDIAFAQLVCIDIDNTKFDVSLIDGKRTTNKTIIDPHNYWSYDDVLNDNFVKNNALLIYTSPSHTDDWNRIRVVFLLDKRIEDKDEYKEICRNLIAYFGDAADKSINNIDRLFFGSTNCNYTILGNVIKLSTINNLKAKPEQLNQFNKDYATNKFNDEKYTLTDSDVRELLQYVNGDILPRDTWISIYASVLSHFGYNTALGILNDWSPDVKKGTDVILNSIAKDNKIKASIGTVVYHAKMNGCDYKDFIKQKTKLLNNQNSYNQNSYSKSDKFKFTNSNTNDNDNSLDDINSTDNNSNKTKSKKSNNSNYNVKEMKDFIEDYLTENYSLRYNLVKHCFEFRKLNTEEWLRFNDRDFNSIQREFMNQGKKIPVHTLRFIVESDFAPDHNPFEYFTNLERIKPKPYHNPNLLTENEEPIVYTDYIEYIAARVPVAEHQQALWLKTFRRWICGAVATAICYKGNSRNDLCPILSGGQGVGKTTFTRMLTPPILKEYSGQVSIRPNNKDGTLAITEMFIIIMDEIESFDKNEQEHLKAIITTEFVNERMPYARYKESIRRTASFIGSINRTEFLSDMTGSRRFPTFQVTNKIDTYTPIDYERFYGEIMYLLEHDYQYWVPYNEIKEIEANNQMFSAINQEEELLLQYVIPSNKDNANAKFQTTTEIKLWLERKSETRLNLRTLGLALRKRMFEQSVKKMNQSVFKGYWVEYIKDTIEFAKEQSTF